MSEGEEGDRFGSAGPSAVSPTSPTSVELFGPTDRPMAADAPYCGLRVGYPTVAFLVVCFVLEIALLLRDSAAVDLVALLCFIPSVGGAVALVAWRRDTVPLRQALVRYVVGFVVLGLLWWVGLVLLVLMNYSVARVAARSAPQAAAIGFLVGVVGGLVVFEETMKLLTVALVDSLRLLPRPSLYPVYSGATAMGLASSITFTVVLTLRRAIDAANTSFCGGNATDCTGRTLSGIHVAVIAVFCVTLLQPLQLLSSYHLGLASAREHVLKEGRSGLRQLPVVVVFRTASLLVFFFAMLFSLVLAFALGIVTSCLYLLCVKRYESAMPREYLRGVGSLNLFGYGMLAADDGDDSPSAFAVNRLDTESGRNVRRAPDDDDTDEGAWADDEEMNAVHDASSAV